MSYVKNEKIKDCPICGSKAHRAREHRSWVHCSNSECILHNEVPENGHLAYHYTKWNNIIKKEFGSFWEKCYLNAVSDINRLTEEVKEYSKSSEYWHDSYRDVCNAMNDLQVELLSKEAQIETLTVCYKKLEEKKQKKSIFQKLFG